MPVELKKSSGLYFAECVLICDIQFRYHYFLVSTILQKLEASIVPSLWKNLSDKLPIFEEFSLPSDVKSEIIESALFAKYTDVDDPDSDDDMRKSPQIDSDDALSANSEHHKYVLKSKHD